MITDKVQPNDIEVEKIVLGAIILERDAMQQVPFLKPEMFYKEAHYHIFNAFIALKNNREPIDMVTVCKELNSKSRLKEIGGVQYVSQLTDRVANSSNILPHARIIQHNWALRNVIGLMQEMLRNCYTDDVDAERLITKITQRLMDVQASFHSGRDVVHISDIIRQEIDEYTQKENGLKLGAVFGVPCGILEVDNHTGGWQKSDLVILAARPAMGKTAFALGSAKSAAKANNTGLYFSLEMSAIQLVRRMLIEDSEIDSYKYRNAQLANGEINALHDARKRLEQLGIYIDETAGIEINELCAKARRAKEFNNIEWIIVDHLHLIRCDMFRRDRIKEVSEISRMLKELAKELNIPVIALAQLSRAVETRGGDKRPILSDLRDSGTIEQDADIVIFLHRDEYYGITQDANGQSTAGCAEVIFAKFRNGAIGTVDVRWIDTLMKFKGKSEAVSPQFPVMQPNNNFLNEPF